MSATGLNGLNVDALDQVLAQIFGNPQKQPPAGSGRPPLSFATLPNQPSSPSTSPPTLPNRPGPSVPPVSLAAPTENATAREDVPGSRGYNLAVGATSQPRVSFMGPKPGIENVEPPNIGGGATTAPAISLAGSQPAQPAAPAAAPQRLSFAQRYAQEQAQSQQKIQDAQTAADAVKPSILRKIGSVAGGVGEGILGGTGAGIATGRAIWNAPRNAAERNVAELRQGEADRLAGIKEGAALEDTEAQSAQRQADTDLARQKIQDAQNPPAAESKPEDVVHAYSAALAAGDTAKAEQLKPLVQEYLNTTKPPAEKAPNDKAQDISDYLAAHNLPDNPTNREKARNAIAARTPNAQVVVQDARGRSYGRNKPTQVLDTWNGNRPVVVSSGEAEDNPGRYVTSTAGVKALGQQTTMDDIEGALNNVKAATKVLDGGTVNRALIASVLADPKTNTQNFLQSAPAGQLSPEEQDYVIAVLTAREVIPGMRTLLGSGQATDARIAKILATLPGAQTPNSEYANKQVDSALGTLKRLRPAVPDVKAKNAPAAPADTSKKGDPLGIL